MSTLECPECSGTGMNAEDKRGDDDDVYINSANVSSNIFVGGQPCWLCRGLKVVPCKDCVGTGIVDMAERWGTTAGDCG